jgi:hypothetical protein
MKKLCRSWLGYGWLLTAMGTVLAQSMPAMDAQERRSTLEDQEQVAVTIYNRDLALVKDVREIRLGKGVNRLAFRDVSAKIKPETALLRSLKAPHSLSLIEQNFDFDLLTPQKLLEKYVGKRIGVVKTHPTTGVESVEEAIVLSANNGVVLRIGDRIETGRPGRLVYDHVPNNLRDRPTLTILLENSETGSQRAELSYLTGGLDWKADYVAELNENDTRLDLNGWVTLTNQSGTTYRNARLQLVAGDVHRIRERMLAVPAVAEMARARAATKEAMQQEELFEYHLYTLDRLTTIADNQTKQVALLGATAVPVEKQYVLKGQHYYYRSSYGDLGQKLKIGVFVEFKNNEQSNLGIPLPKGIVRVYKSDQTGNAQFVGEDRIDHTPKNEEIRLKLGEAFDITADKKQTEFRKLAAVGRYNYVLASSYEIVLKNAKSVPVTVVVQEPVPGDWEITEESHPHEKQAVGTAAWEIEVPAEGKTTLTYTVHVRF